MVCCKQQPQTLSELQSEYITIDDSIKIHYKIWNASDDTDVKTLCFVHGFGCDINTWEKQFEAFRDDTDLQLVFMTYQATDRATSHMWNTRSISMHMPLTRY